MKKLLLAFILSVTFLSSCGKKDEEFKYQLSENKCDTGEHKSDSKQAMCTQLKDDAINNGCATNLRKQKYEGDGCGSWGS